MSTEDNVVATTPAEEAIQPEGTATPEGATEETVGAILQDKPEVDQIPKARLDKEIARRKEAEQQAQAAQKALADLQAKATSSDMTKAEITSDLQDIAREYDLDPKFISKLAGAIEARADAKVEEKLRPLNERDRQQKIDAAFSQGFNRAIENMPEYKDIVNPAVIKTLSLDPANANKTFSQLIADTYGSAIHGRKTIEITKPRAGAQDIDFSRAKSDPDYFKEIMRDPQLKKEYNDKMFN